MSPAPESSKNARTYAAGPSCPMLLSPPAPARLLQRTCACGGAPDRGGTCEECGKKHLQRQIRNSKFEIRNFPEVSPIAHEVFRSPGQSLDSATPALMESHFGHHFSRVRVHPSPRMDPGFPLTIGEPGDRFEQEADRAAEQVMRFPDRTPRDATVRGAGLGLQENPWEVTGCAERLQRETRNPFDPDEGLVKVKEEGAIQRKQTAGQAAEAPTDLPAQITRVRSGGQVMPQSLRTLLEPRFGHDFSRVRIHTDAMAVSLAHSLNARAFTLGHNLVFGAGEYAPETDGGRRLLAHELTHVIQQGEAPPILQRPQQGRTRVGGGLPVERGSARPYSIPSRDGGHHAGQALSTVSRDSKTIRRVKWNPNTSTGHVSYPWGTGPGGDVLTAATDAGTSMEIWRPHNGTTYWCHGYTFGGSTATGGPYSFWGKTVPTVLKDDGWQQVYSCLARAQDILVFYDSGGRAMHSGIVRSVAAPGAAIDEGASTLESKWGQLPLSTSSWRTNSKRYGGYRCYSKSGAQGPCSAAGANELS